MPIFEISAADYYKLLKFCAALLGVSLLTAVATPARTDQLSDQIECGKGSGITLSVPAPWEKVETDMRAVMCAFRTAGVGFPTLNVIREPSAAVPSTHGVDERIAEVLRSYHLIGLTDAVVESHATTVIDGRDALEIVLRYSSQGERMTALVTLMELEDRVLTITALDRSLSFNTTVSELRRISQSVRGQSAGLASTTPSVENAWNAQNAAFWLILAGIVGVIVVAGSTVLRLRRR